MNGRTLTFALLLSGLLVPLLSSCAATPTEESTGQYLDSSVITAKVKSKLFEDQALDPFAVHVNTFRDTVQLSGFVDTSQDKEQAVNIARNVPGVKLVVDDLIVKHKS